ncbi:MAG: tetratricopeptide repeat protein [Woeseiaceae bacterium]
MKILRHILSHLFLIFFLLAVVSVFYYRTLLLPNDVVVKVDGIVNEVYPPALKFVSKRDYFWSIRGERIVSFDDLNLFEKEDDVTSKAKSTDMAEVEIPIKDDDKNIVVTLKDVETSKTDAVQSENKIQKESVVIVVKVDEPVVVKEQVLEHVKKNNEVEELSVEVKDSDTSSERDLLINARKAFNSGNKEQSEKFYIELTQLDEDNPDAFGELGNVYYSQGKWDKAGQAYYEAAVRLINERKYSQVTYLQQVIKGLSLEHAEKLSQLMLRK